MNLERPGGPGATDGRGGSAEEAGPIEVERAVLREIQLALRAPFRTSAGVVAHRRILLLTLVRGDTEGWAECVALADPSYTEETVDSAWEVLSRLLVPRAVGEGFWHPEEVLTPSRWIRGNRMAKATLEMAAWDLTAKERGISLSRILGGVRDTVPVGVSVGIEASDEALCDTVAHYLDEGYARAKVKIMPGRDVAMVQRLRAHLPQARLMVDANCAYAPRDLDTFLALDELGLEMIEQPLAHDDVLEHARLQARLRTPLCLDESIRSESDLALAIELGVGRILNLKPGRVGGLAESRRMHDRMVAEGGVPWVGGMLESGIGRAHNVALASLPGFSVPGDLSGSRRYWERDIVSPEFEVRDGVMRVPTGPGIGVEVDLDRIEALTTRRLEFW